MTTVQQQTQLISYTGRLRLVRPNAADDELVSIMRSHPHTRRYLRFLPEQISVDEVRSRRESRANDPKIIDFHIHMNHDDGTTTFVGQCGLFNIDILNDSCSAGIIISPDFYQCGLGTDTLYTLFKFAFEDQALHRVGLETGVDNVAMRNWLEKVIEAPIESRLREHWKDGPGNYSDSLGYGILDWEWRQSIKARLVKRLLVGVDALQRTE